MSDGLNLTSRFRRLAELRTTEDEAKAAQRTAIKERQEYERALVEELEDAGIEGTLTFNLGPPHGTVAFTLKKPTVYGRVINEAEARESLAAIGRLDELKGEKWQERRVNEFVREAIQRGEALPDGLDFYTRGGITMSTKDSPDMLE